jgi:hypothetical protein
LARRAQWEAAAVAGMGAPLDTHIFPSGLGMTSEILSGVVDYETGVGLHSTDDHGVESGQVRIYGGPGKGMIRIVIASATPVRLEIDTDGDDTARHVS